MYVHLLSWFEWIITDYMPLSSIARKDEMVRHIEGIHDLDPDVYPPILDSALGDPRPLPSHRNVAPIVLNPALFRAALNLSAAIRRSVLTQMNSRHEHLQGLGGTNTVVAISTSLYTAQGFVALSALQVSEGGNHSTPFPPPGATSSSGPDTTNEAEPPQNFDLQTSSPHSRNRNRSFERGSSSTPARTHIRGASFNNGPSTHQRHSSTNSDLIYESNVHRIARIIYNSPRLMNERELENAPSASTQTQQTTFFPFQSAQRQLSSTPYTYQIPQFPT